MNHNEPTWHNQLWHAYKLASDKGTEALWNPHGMIGKTCGCGQCFCCAAYAVFKQMEKVAKK